MIKSPMLSRGEKDAMKERVVKKIESEFEGVAPALVHIAREIIKQKPDQVIFLDKSARIFATPMRKFIREKVDAREIPAFKFINDDVLRFQYYWIDKKKDGETYCINRQESETLETLDAETTKAFSFIKGKNTFVVDEMLSLGMELQLWMKAFQLEKKESPETKLSFFALSEYEKERRVVVAGESFVRDAKEDAGKMDGFNLFISDYVPDTALFSRRVPAFRYVGEDEDPKTGELTGKILGARSALSDYYDVKTREPKIPVLDDVPMERLEDHLSFLYEFVGKAKDLIYDKMIEADKKNN